MNKRKICSPARALSKARAFISSAVALALLAATLAPASLAAPRRAQEDDGSTPQIESVAYRIVQTEDGEVACEALTPAEARAVDEAAVQGEPLRQINHLDEKGAPLALSSATNMTIILRGTAQLEANAEAKAAFVAAAAKWEALIANPVVIIIDVDFGTTAFGTAFPSDTVLGVATTPAFAPTYSTHRQRLINSAAGAEELALYNLLPVGSVPTDAGATQTVVVTSPNLRIMPGQTTLPTDARNDPTTNTQPRIGFNSNFGFDFNPENGITSGQSDFDAVAVHEIGHALGFSSRVGEREVDSTAPVRVSNWDLFRFRPGTTLANFAIAERILSTGGEHRSFNGGVELALSTGNPQGQNGDARQASHWKDDSFTFTYLGIMDPTIPRSSRRTMTDNDRRVIDFLGYTINSTTPQPTSFFHFSQAAYTISEEAGSATVFVTREGDTSQQQSVTLTTANGSATAGSDYTARSVPLTFNPGQTGIGLLIPVINDTAIEPDETFTVTLSNPTNGAVVVAPLVTTVTITNDDPNAGASAVQLSGTNFVVPEQVTNGVPVTIRRTGDISGPASVDYATANGTASDMSDYAAAYGTMSFQPGQAEKSFSLFITNDRFVEPSETLTVTLSNAVGTTLGTNQVATYTISSEDTANGQSPVRGGASFDPQFFVRQHYRDFLNRDPDAAGLSFWAGQTTNCGTTDLLVCRVNVSAAFFLSPEFQDTGFYVIRMQRVASGKRSGVEGARIDIRQFIRDARQVGDGYVGGQPGSDQVLEANRQAYATRVVSGADFIASFPTTLTGPQYVDALFARAGVAGTAAEKQAANIAYNNTGGGTASRVAALRSVSESASVRDAEFRTAFVLMQYFGYMRRNPDQLGYDFWLGKLNEFNGNYVAAQMVQAFITSTEYEERFGL